MRDAEFELIAGAHAYGRCVRHVLRLELDPLATSNPAVQGRWGFNASPWKLVSRWSGLQRAGHDQRAAKIDER